MSLVPKKGGEGNGDAPDLLHPEQIPPPHMHLQLPPPALCSAPHRPICPPVPPTSLYLVSCLPRIPFRPLGTTPLPLGCGVQPIIWLLALPRVLSPSVKAEPPPIYLLIASGSPIFPLVCPRAFCFPPSVLQSPLLTHRSQDCSVSSFGASPPLALRCSQEPFTPHRTAKKRKKLLSTQQRIVS